MEQDKFTKIVYTVNERTGEIISQTMFNDDNSNVVLKYTVDEMIRNAKTSKELDSTLLFHWCKIIRAINGQNQIQTFGNKLKDEIEDELIQQGIICAYVLKCIKLAHPFTHILKKNFKSQITTWGELWKLIDCKDSSTQKKVKQFLENNKLIKAVPIKTVNGESKKLFVLNPYLYKNSSHAGQFACIVWQESAKPNININFYAYMWLVSQDVIINDNDFEYDRIIKEFFLKQDKSRGKKK